MPFSTPGEKITFMISGLIGLKRSVRGESIAALARTKAEMALPFLFVSNKRQSEVVIKLTNT